MNSRARSWLRVAVPACLVAALAGCDRSQPVAPLLEAGVSGAGGPTVKAPSNTNAIAVSESRIDVSWQDNSTNETGFEVWRLDGTFTKVGANITTYVDARLNPLTRYCYQVRAFRTYDGKTSYSDFSPNSPNTACATTPAPPAPTAPSGTDAKPANSLLVAVSWIDNSTTEDGFRLERSRDLGFTWALVGTVGPNVTSLSDDGRASEQQVCYRVIAFNRGGDSPPSNSDCTTPPAGPTNLTAAAAAEGIDLAWTDNSAVEDGYEVQRATAEFGPYGLVADLAPNATSYQDAGLATNHTYWYRVRTKKDGGFSDFSNVASALVLATVPPNAPSGTDATPTGLDAGGWPSPGSAVDVTWTNNAANEDGFRVERSTDGGATWATAGTTLAAQTEFWDGAVASEQQVCYRVIAFNSVGGSPPSNTDCTTPPAAPTDLAATVVDVQTIELTWTDNSAVEDGYEVLVDRLGEWLGMYVVADLPPNSTRYRVWVGCGGGGVFVVRAKRDGGFSGFSDSILADMCT